MNLEDRPYVANYPPLQEWLRKHDARCMWQTTPAPRTDPDEALTMVEGWMVGDALCVILVYANRGGWEVLTAHPDPNIERTLRDAEKRLGVS